MSHYLTDLRLAALHISLKNEIGFRRSDHIPFEINARELARILDELKQRRRKAGGNGVRLGKTTKLLMNLKVGEKVEIPPISQGALTTAKETARKRMGDAVAWRSSTTDQGTTLIERMPDGWYVYERSWRNEAIPTMANMKVGDVVVLTTVKGRMHNGLKVKARELADNALMNWRCENLANGNIKCRRFK